MKVVFPMASTKSCCELRDDYGRDAPDMKQAFVLGSINTATGEIPTVGSELTLRDKIGSVKARWGLGRMNFKVDPGLYALGHPSSESPVFVTANYKMSFDCLRAALKGISSWILVLDTKGINVWCAAGKGTFGTDELIGRIKSCGLDRLVSHKTVVVPQLGAPGIGSQAVRRASGFRVVFGPVAAKDLPKFIADGLKATPEMRRKDFPIGERIALVPVELVQAMRMGIIAVLFFSLLGALFSGGGYLDGALHHGGMALAAVSAAVASGAVATPILLPWIPGRAFSLKGALLGTIGAVVLVLLEQGKMASLSGTVEVLSWAMIVVAGAAYLAMNFTGASTFTSLSGVKKEMKWAVPMQVGAGILGLCLIALSGVLD